MEKFNQMVFAFVDKFWPLLVAASILSPILIAGVILLSKQIF